MLKGIDNKDNLDTYITNQYSYLVDKSNVLSFDEIQSLQNQFIDSPPQDIPFQLADETYWISLIVSNNSKKREAIALYADNSLLSSLDIYQKNYDDSFTINELAKNSTTKKKLDKVYLHTRFSLNSGASQHFYIKIKTEGPPNVPLMALTVDSFEKRVLYAQLVYGAFIGVILLIALYNVVLFIGIKDKVYLVYIGYLLSAFFVLASLTGFGYLIFPGNIQTIINNYIIFFHYILTIFLLLFALLFLRYDQTSKRIFNLGRLICVILFALSIYSLSIDLITQAKIFFSLQPVIVLFALFIVGKRVKTDFSWARFYLLSWIPLLVGAVIQPLVLLNYLDYSFLTSNAFLFGIMIEITLMAFALAERMKRNEQDRINDIAYHVASGLPRKSNIERVITQLISSQHPDFSVLFIKPQNIEQVTLYIDDTMNTDLFKYLFKRLSSLVNFNDAVLSLTDKNEKLCFINNNGFALIVNNKKNMQSLSTLIDSIQQIISENFKLGQLQLPLSGVIGIANFPEHGNQSHQLLNHAQLGINQAELSNSKWAEYQKDASDKESYLLTLTAQLKTALEQDQLEIYHQPQIDLKTLRVCSSECLLRWRNGSDGFIPPATFVPLAEDMGLINQLTLWVIKKALEQQLMLSDEYGYKHMVSINISGKDLSSDSFFTSVLDIIEQSGISADKIVFELTESASFANNKHALELIDKLTELGITISIDDFGTGYSSMSQISNLPFQELKVDRQFVENVCQDKKRKIIAESTVKMAKGLGLEVVAEGINSQEDENTLRQFGCDIGQGFYYAKPMPIEDYIKWLGRLANGRIAPSIVGEFIPADK